VKPPLRGFDVIFKRTLWNAVTRTALCAGRGTAFARRPATTLMLKKRCRAEYRLPPHWIHLPDLRDAGKNRAKDEQTLVPSIASRRKAEQRFYSQDCEPLRGRNKRS